MAVREPKQIRRDSHRCLDLHRCQSIGAYAFEALSFVYVLLDKVDTLTDVSVSPNGLSHKTTHLCNTIVRRNLDKHLFGMLSSCYA